MKNIPIRTGGVYFSIRKRDENRSSRSATSGLLNHSFNLRLMRCNDLYVEPGISRCRALRLRRLVLLFRILL